MSDHSATSRADPPGAMAELWRRQAAIPPWLIVALVAGALLVVGLGIGKSPVLVATLALGAMLVALTFLRPQLGTFAVCLLLYSNAPVIAVRFHDVPYLVGAAYPLLLLVPLFVLLVVERRRFVVVPALPFVLLYGLVMAFSAVFARRPDVAWTSVLEFATEGLLIYVLITNVVRTTETLRLATWALLLAGIVMGGVPLYQQLTGQFLHDFGGFGQLEELPFGEGGGLSAQHRLSGPIGEKNRYAQLMLMLMPLALIVFRSERHRALKWLALVAAAVSAIGFVLAFSRGGAVALIITLVVAVMIGAVTRRQLIPVLVGAALLLVVNPHYLYRISSVGEAVGLVTSSPGREPDSAMKGRATEMLAAVLVFFDHPVKGVGPGMFRYYSRQYGNQLNIRRLEEDRYSHCLYLDVASETGLLGVVVFTAMMGVTLRDLQRARRRRSEAGGWGPELATAYMLALMTYLAAGFFLHFSYVRYFWLIMALSAAAGAVAARPPEPEGRTPARASGDSRGAVQQ